MNSDSTKLRITFALIMAGLMVSVLTFVLGPLRQQFASGWPALWLQMWLLAFPVAVPAIWLLGPVARRIALRLCGVRPPAQGTSLPHSPEQETSA